VALGPQRGLETVEEGTMPRQEETGGMNLGGNRVRMSPPI